MSLNIIKLQERTCGEKGKHKVFQMSVPKEIVKKLNWKKGIDLIVTEKKDSMVVKKTPTAKTGGDL